MFEKFDNNMVMLKQGFPSIGNIWKFSPLMTHLRNKDKVSKKCFDEKERLFLFVIFLGCHWRNGYTESAFIMRVPTCRNCCITTKPKWISFPGSSGDCPLLYLCEVEYKQKSFLKMSWNNLKPFFFSLFPNFAHSFFCECNWLKGHHLCEALGPLSLGVFVKI